MGSISIICPAHNEAQNIPALYDEICRVMEPLDWDWHLIIVDDFSDDNTFSTVRTLAEGDARVSGIRLMRNVGSHLAISCGLDHATGDCAVVMAADLQDPPTIIPDLLQEWQKGAQVVWGGRERYEVNRVFRFFSHVFYWALCNLLKIRGMPKSGADMFLIDGAALPILRQCREKNVNVFTLVSWLGFPQSIVTYVKEARRYGKSSWTFAKNLKFIIDTIIGFSYLPIRLMSLVGVIVALLGFAYATYIVFMTFGGEPIKGWASLIVIVLVLGGLQMVMLGTLGEYQWRTLDETRRRPPYVIAETVGDIETGKLKLQPEQYSADAITTQKSKKKVR